MGQAKVDQIVPRGPPRPCEPLGSSFETSASIDLDGMKPFRVHPRRIEHDVISCTVPGRWALKHGPLIKTLELTCAQYFVRA
jgi:hypothetical protein